MLSPLYLSIISISLLALLLLIAFPFLSVKMRTKIVKFVGVNSSDYTCDYFPKKESSEDYIISIVEKKATEIAKKTTKATIETHYPELLAFHPQNQSYNFFNITKNNFYINRYHNQYNTTHAPHLHLPAESLAQPRLDIDIVMSNNKMDLNNGKVIYFPHTQHKNEAV